MAEITASLVKELREKTGAGMMDCKKALNETAGDLEAAVDWLRQKGLAAAAKKSSRVAAEGLVGVVVAGNAGAALEVNAETDFVARNEQFQGFVLKASELVLAVKGDVEALKTQAFPGGERNVAEELTNMIATIGENMNIRRAEVLSVDPGVVASYVHNSLVPGLGKIGVLVALKSSGDAGKLGEFGKKLAMHVAAASPIALVSTDIPADVLEREKNVLREKARASGKPDNIIEKMLEGGLRKYYEQVTLLEQTYVIDGESKVKDAVAAFAKELGAAVELTGFVRMQLGEGIEKEVSDFAAEVAAQAAGKA